MSFVIRNIDPDTKNTEIQDKILKLKKSKPMFYLNFEKKCTFLLIIVILSFMKSVNISTHLYREKHLSQIIFCCLLKYVVYLTDTQKKQKLTQNQLYPEVQNNNNNDNKANLNSMRESTSIWTFMKIIDE